MLPKKNLILISGAVIFKDYRGKRTYLLVKPNNEDHWEIPKVTVRRGESSVRAAIRMMGESGGITSRVLEEAGRAAGSALVNGKSIPQKYYYYLMVQKSAGEAIGFTVFKWMEYGKAIKLLSLKREKDIFKDAKDVLKKWEKEHKKND
jgi:ADP-ribose pyrophosphatase YjhB (NUDIX family)